MQIYTTYKVKIKHYNHIFKDTVLIYRKAVDFLIEVCLREWDSVSELNSNQRINRVERLTHNCSRRFRYQHSCYDQCNV